MTRAYRVIDADGHILEPLSLWTDYMDPKYRDRAPRLIIDADGKQRLMIEEQVLGSKKGLGALGGVGARDGVVVDDAMEYEQGRKGGFDPHARIPDMDLDGIDAAFLYPSIGLFCGSVKDPDLAAAVARAYNRWLADYCKPYPDRLFGVAMIPLQSVDRAVEEMRFARKELGMRGAFIRPNPYSEKMVDQPEYDRFWSTAEDLDMSVGFHEGGGAGMPQVGSDRVEGRGARHIVSHTMEMMLACLAVIWGGVCEKHPKLRIAFLESGGGWIAPWLDRMNRHFDDIGFNDSGLKTRPSELFERNCWIAFEPVETCLKVLAEFIGPHKILWATDYPHPDGFFPGAPDMMRGLLGNASAETTNQILGGSAMKFYGLH
ncbi:MAG: amidohydrolase family protein [Acetobacteraceae bacterium]